MSNANKAKNYSIIGTVLVLFGLAQQVFVSMVFLFASGKEFLAALTILNVVWILINPFILAGIIFLWRADKNKIPPAKSTWFRAIVIIYVILVFSFGIYAMNAVIKRSKQGFKHENLNYKK